MDAIWNESRSIYTAALTASSTPGVYLLGHLHEFAGVPVRYEWAYVGRANSLAKRLVDHFPANETYVDLKKWLRSEPQRLVIRFSSTSLEDSVTLERELIRNLAPKLNRILYRSYRESKK